MTAIIIGTPDVALFYERLFGVAPYALYCLASDLVAGTDYAVGDDLMGGSPLIKTGTPVDHGAYAAVSHTDYWTTPFTGTTLADATSAQHGFTALAVARAAAGENLSAISSFAGSTLVTNFGLYLVSSVYRARAIANTPNRATTGMAADYASRGDRFAAYAATVSPTNVSIYDYYGGQLHAGMVASGSSQDVGGPAMRIGTAPAGLNTTAGDMALVAFYPKPLSQAEVLAASQGLDAWLTPVGLDLS